MRNVRAPFLASAIVAIAGCGGGSGGTIPVSPAGAVAQASAQRVLRVPLGPRSIEPADGATGNVESMCRQPLDPERATCFASFRTQSVLTTLFPDAVNGLTPTDLASLYAYPAPALQGAMGHDQTVAVVVAFDYGAAEADLAVYRAQFGLPPCTRDNGCFKTIGVDATGLVTPIGAPSSITAHPTSPGDLGWAAETDIDLAVVSAVCPNCRILLAEAATDSIADLSAAVKASVSAEASIVNASFGAPEHDASARYASVYGNSKNVKVVAAAGDWGHGVYYPASDPNVIAVGGTSLASVGSSVVETAWSGTGSGCSAVFPKSSWQSVPSDGCQMRNVVDVAAVADPLTGVAVYDSSLTRKSGGWAIFGGTSVAAPIVAAMYALSGKTEESSLGAQRMYARPTGFLAITSGSNGTCVHRYLCVAGPTKAYNGPTGLGIPQGLGGF
ncbi:MAG: peptidase S8 [Vulcanimicrobiaceae bacterium]